MHKETRADADTRERRHEVRLDGFEIRDGFDVHIPNEPRRADQHQHDASGQMAREFSRCFAEGFWTRQAIDLRSSHAATEENGQQRQFH